MANIKTNGNFCENNSAMDNYDKNELSNVKKDTNKVIGKTFSRHDIKWWNVFLIVTLHVLWIYSLLTFPYVQRYKTTLYICFMIVFSGFGVTGGAHRLWSHKSFEANQPLRILLAIAFLSSLQNRIYDWVRDHRVHHKFSETDADPHNSLRGFFYAHVGWLMVKKNLEVIAKGKQIDMSDIENDPVIAFCDKYFHTIRFAITLITIAIPVYFWNEDWYYAAMSQLIRFIYITNATWSLNSFGHMWGLRPYDKNIAPAESKVANYLSHGEGWHNYHHTFPCDYRAPETILYLYDMTGVIIDFFAKVGWAYNCKTATVSLVNMTIDKRGDRFLADSIKKSV